MARNFSPNFGAIRAMAVGPEIRGVLLEIAEKAKAEAVSIAADFAQTGEYMNSFEVSETTVNVADHARAAAVLENTSPHAAAVEWGNSRDPKAHHVIARALAALKQ